MHQDHHKRVFIVIPAKDEGSRIGGVLEKLHYLGYRDVVVVDDASQDGTGTVAQSWGVHVVKHRINLGAGAATQTGISFALQQGAEVIVTIDADHQHCPTDIPRIVRHLHESGADFVLGSRFLQPGNQIPNTRVVYNKIANQVNYLLTGLTVTDSQTGFKAFTAGYARNLKITHNGFEFCIEMLHHARKNRSKISEFPVRVFYTKDTMSKGQNLLTGIRMLYGLRKFF